MPTTFQLRATALGAAPLLYDVSVGTEFGELEVALATGSARPVVAHELRVLADVPCGDVPEATGGERRVGLAATSTRFPALATAAAWTVDARGVSESGSVVARGCVEGVRLTPGAPTMVTVSVRDLPLRADGVYRVDLALSAATLGAEARVSTFESALPDSGASLLLDGLRQELDARATTDVTALRVARAAGLDVRLELELEASETSLARELEPLALEVERGFDGLTLEATLRHGATTSLEGAGARVGAAILPAGYAARLAGAVFDPARDVLSISGIELDAGPGSLFASALLARAQARSTEGLPAVIRDGAACGTMLLAVTRERVLTACDARCVRQGCVRAAADIEARLRDGALEIDARFATVRFDADVSLADSDADLRVDDTSAAGIAARWGSSDGAIGTTLEARWSGQRDDALE